MKILFISRATLYKDKGGDTVQLLNTAKYLRQIGVEVDIRLCNEAISYDGYDLLHFFNIIRPADILSHSERSGKPYVVSTIFVEYAEYEKKARTGLSGLVFRNLSSDLIEYAKVIARFLVNGEKILSPEYLWLGQKRSIRKIIRHSALLLPNSVSEYKRLETRYGLSHPFLPIPNAIEPSLFHWQPDLPKEPKMIICVGRIEGRKNQLNLIRAISGTDMSLYIIGNASANQPGYYKACREAAGANVTFIENIPQEALLQYYQKAQVHILPSWFETTGLSSLEAAVMGCNVVITDKGDTREYFGELAWYCDPESVASIRQAVENAVATPVNDKLQAKILQHYTWQETARKTLEAYQQIIKSS